MNRVETKTKPIQKSVSWKVGFISDKNILNNPTSANENEHGIKKYYQLIKMQFSMDSLLIFKTLEKI